MPIYIKALLKRYPHVGGGRKNFEQHHLRINKTLKLIKKYFKKN